eukprot:TRINITY_DN74388_c0_g1_i1.p1 TRINITY_DN74388_c0_g1~~TRINITY_DN74388_c0_g1_i1.p1  ORF type:complete len:969 (-),score=164.79 TRINITY_DN74388_c0_g1_i1:153-3011(-)
MGIFTREESELLNYDGDAFFYFALTILSIVLFPWTYATAKKIANPTPPEDYDYGARGPAKEGLRMRFCGTSTMQKKRVNSALSAKSWFVRLSNWVWLQFIVLAILWYSFFRTIASIHGLPDELKSFDPYRILDLSVGADVAVIKKAYRKMSLQLHPDKNPDDPLASAKFQQVAKAYAALTDDAARLNFEKYGNPDGPGQMKMGIGLHPRILADKDSRGYTLLMFFGAVLSVPTAVLCCCLRGGGIAASHVSQQTIEVYQQAIDEDMTAKDGASLLAASAEARRLGMLPLGNLVNIMTKVRPQALGPGVMCEVRDESDLKGQRVFVRSREPGSLVCKVELSGGGSTRDVACSCLSPIEPAFDCMFSEPTLRRSSLVIWAYIWRMHDHIDLLLKASLFGMLRQFIKIGRAMTTMAAHGPGDRGGYLSAVKETIVFRRCIVQCLDPKADPLLQLPGVTGSKFEEAKKAVGANNVPTLQEVVAGSGDKFLEKLGLRSEERLDVTEFCRHLSVVELECRVEVEDEENVAEEDLATLFVTLTRTNLAEDEAVGCVHAPLFPGPKFEEWWLLVYDEVDRRLVTVEPMLGTSRTEDTKIRFMVPRKGRFHWTIHALCDSYSGMDVKHDLYFTALGKRDIKKEIFVHPADMKIRTLFEEIMLGPQLDDEESDSDSDAEDKAVANQTAQVLAAKPQIVQEPDSDEEYANEPEGVFYKAGECGAHIYRQPDEDSQRLGSLPASSIVRGFDDGDRPEGWMEIAASGGAWLRVGPSKSPEMKPGVNSAERLGEFGEQRLRTIVQTCTPLWLLRRWMKAVQHDIDGEDAYQVFAIEDRRVRAVVQELMRERVGDERFAKLQDECESKRSQKKARLKKALGYFATGNGVVWHVGPNGQVRGLHADGSRVRDNVDISADNRLRIGPFALDEKKTCSCIHWDRVDDPTKSWTWSRDETLQTRIRLGSRW